LWGIFELGILMLSAGRKRSLGEIYFIKAIKYVFLADVTFLFCFDSSNSNMYVMNQVILSGIILLTYFIGKLQKSQNKSMFFKISGANMPHRQTSFNVRAETFVIVLSLVVFVAFWFFPQYASNPISKWFHDSIINIEDTPVFGFIFKVIGFFFLLSLIFKMVNAFTFLLSGGKVRNQSDNNDDNNDKYDNFEELS
jgi:hypothetical protein